MIGYRHLNFLISWSEHTSWPAWDSPGLSTLLYSHKWPSSKNKLYAHLNIGSHMLVMRHYYYYEPEKNRRWKEEARQGEGLLWSSVWFITQNFHQYNAAVTKLPTKPHSRILALLTETQETSWHNGYSISSGTKQFKSWLCLSIALRPWQTSFPGFKWQFYTMGVFITTEQVRASVDFRYNLCKMPTTVPDKTTHKMTDVFISSHTVFFH